MGKKMFAETDWSEVGANLFVILLLATLVFGTIAAICGW